MLDNENLFLEIGSQSDISLCIEFLERFYKKNKNKDKKPLTGLKEVQVSELGPRILTTE